MLIDGSHRDATSGSNMFVIEPSLFDPATAAGAAPSDDFGLSGILVDFSWLGL